MTKKMEQLKPSEGLHKDEQIDFSNPPSNSEVRILPHAFKKTAPRRYVYFCEKVNVFRCMKFLLIYDNLNRKETKKQTITFNLALSILLKF